MQLETLFRGRVPSFLTTFPKAHGRKCEEFPGPGSGGRRENYCSTETEFQFGKMKRFCGRTVVTTARQRDRT